LAGLIVGVATVCGALLSPAASAVESSLLVEGLRSLHVQDGGRIKPLDTFASESLQVISGKSSFRGKDAIDVMMTWMLAPEAWDTLEFVEVRHSGLRETLKLPHDQFLFAPKSLLGNDRVGLVITELRSMRERGSKLNPYYTAVSRLENQLSLYMAIRSGEALRLVPPKPNSQQNEKWLNVAELQGPLKDAFLRMSSSYAHALTGHEEEQRIFLQDTKVFKDLARAQNPELYGPEWINVTEVIYNHAHPFRWAWVLYLFALILMAFRQVFENRWSRGLCYIVTASGLFLHITGIVLRCVINGRPPVSNMYETVIWVPLGAIVLSLILARIYKIGAIVVASLCVGILCLILADVSPVILDASLQPLEPVLRSNFWLSTHVVIITLSYAAFFLAFGVGDVLLYYYLQDPGHAARQIQMCSQVIYRSIQVGVVLLALGVILGGIWADYSWGRFWGWDPKETWALIALLGYLALLHARLVGMVRNFGMGVGAVLGFALVIMAWYGVNFVLGAGLHSYGFGAGGIEYVSGFVLLHVIYVAYVTTVHTSQLKNASKKN
jgi:cytochrome c-type biogenesis protein CcsB